MIIPSIDLSGGTTVQLVGGRDKALDAGDPLPIARQFGLIGEIAVIDLDAAMRRGSNADTIRGLLDLARCRVGGGIRDYATAVEWLDAGAQRIILGTAAQPDLLRRLPRERLIAALDARDGEIVVNGWQTPTGNRVLDRMKELRDLVGGFLITNVNREGRLQGCDIDWYAELVKEAGDTRITAAGGVASPGEVAALDTIGVDVQVGMALYTGRFDLAAALAAMLKSDRKDGLWPTVVVDESGIALGLTYSSEESLRKALQQRRGVYQSRQRGIWTKGETSGATQELLRVDLDCDRDTLRFVVRQSGQGFCHAATRTCWGDAWGLSALAERIAYRARKAETGSYTRRLLCDPQLLKAKLVEEAEELADAQTPSHVAAEAADLLYFACVALNQAGVSLSEVEAILDRRSLKLTRRPGNAKPRLENAR